ncbi:MAG: OsmC family protein [Acidobacteria bacterium]|nr:OsmC family protein [Acidobacteriota bacterium]
MHQASIENRGDSRLLATTRRGGFLMDAQGLGTDPVDALLASLCGCLGRSLRAFLHQERRGGEAFTISARAGLTPDGTLVDTIEVLVSPEGSWWNEAQRERMLQSLRGSKVFRILSVVPGIRLALAEPSVRTGTASRVLA